MPEIIDPVFAKTSQNARFGLVFVKTRSINSGNGVLMYDPVRLIFFRFTEFLYANPQNVCTQIHRKFIRKGPQKERATFSPSAEFRWQRARNS